MKTELGIPVLGFAAYSGTGKTTLLESLLPRLTKTGLRIGMLKHAHHDFDVDKPGKDSYRLRKAGASQMLISSRYRHAMMTETPNEEAEFDYLLSRFDTEQLDIVLVEGCKNIAFPKIELHREAVGKPWLYPSDSNIIAIASDSTPNDALVPCLDINDLDAMVTFVCDYAKSHQAPSAPTSACCDTLSPAFLSVEQGQTKILAQISPISGKHTTEVGKAHNRVLSEPVISPINVPAYTNSAMDGYAIRGDDLQNDVYTLVGEVLAGYAYGKELKQGETVKIMTGAPMPLGADTVVMREQATLKGDLVTFSTKTIKQGQNVRQAGEDLKQNEAVFPAGQRLGSAEMGMLASLGMGTCPVYNRVKVAIFSTGDEVQAPGSPLKSNSIFDSNRYTLIGLLTSLGCEVVDLGILEDNKTSMIQALRVASKDADMVITSGGVSVGDADYIKQAMDALGSIDFWRINMRPGRPLAFGEVASKPFLGLPGNPVAVMVSFINFVEPAIRKLQGETTWSSTKISAVATESLRSRQGRTEFSRGIYSIGPDGRLVVTSTGQQGSGILRSMSEANCLIEIAPHIDSVKAGESVTIIPLQGRI